MISSKLHSWICERMNVSLVQLEERRSQDWILLLPELFQQVFNVLWQLPCILIISYSPFLSFALLIALCSTSVLLWDLYLQGQPLLH